MRKRINVQVDKLIAKPQKSLKAAPDPASSHKPLSFQQLYHLARKTSLSHSAHQPTPLSNHKLSESLKPLAQTPQNSTRGLKEKADLTHKLNRSLQAKSNSIQKHKGYARSFSSQKKHLVEQWKAENNKHAKQSIKNNSFQETAQTESNSPHETEAIQFHQEFSKIISQLNHKKHQHLRQTQCFLNIEETFQIMKQLHYLRKIQDQKYLVRIWQELQGQTYGGIPSQNLYEFLTYINHYHPANLFPQSRPTDNPHKKVIINSHLKIVATEKSKLDIYEEYLALRVNRILYGNSDPNYPQSIQKKLQRTSNIKIVDDDVDQHSDKKKPSSQQTKLSFAKKTTTLQEVANNPPRRAVRLKSGGGKLKAKRLEETDKEHLEDTIYSQIYSEISQTKDTGKNISSSQSESSIYNSQSTEQLIDKKPILSIDVNMGQGVSQKLLVFQGESAVDVSKRLVSKYNIDQSLRLKFQTMLNTHIRNLLWRIEEVSEDMFSDREE